MVLFWARCVFLVIPVWLLSNVLVFYIQKQLEIPTCEANHQSQTLYHWASRRIADTSALFGGDRSQLDVN